MRVPSHRLKSVSLTKPFPSGQVCPERKKRLIFRNSWGKKEVGVPLFGTIMAGFLGSGASEFFDGALLRREVRLVLRIIVK